MTSEKCERRECDIASLMTVNVLFENLEWSRESSLLDENHSILLGNRSRASSDDYLVMTQVYNHAFARHDACYFKYELVSVTQTERSVLAFSFSGCPPNDPKTKILFPKFQMLFKTQYVRKRTHTVTSLRRIRRIVTINIAYRNDKNL